MSITSLTWLMPSFNKKKEEHLAVIAATMVEYRSREESVSQKRGSSAFVVLNHSNTHNIFSMKNGLPDTLSSSFPS